MLPRESVFLEYKESVTPSYLKTVSAFANFGSGRVVFGVDDGRCAVGLEDPAGDALRIENAINDSIDPRPVFSLEVDEEARTVTLIVEEGAHKPYLCKGKAYRRSDSSTVEVDKLEYGRLVLEGSNQYFDQLESKRDDLSFQLLGKRLSDVLGIESLDSDVMRTLGLQNKQGKYVVRDIKRNRQGEEKSLSNLEENARNELRKWDNVKHLCERIPEKRKVAKDRLDSDFWGLRVITKERVSDGRRNDLAYGVVVTLHEINGVNRIDEFESACLANGWLVNRVDVTERVEIHNKAEEEIHFES